MPMEISLCNEVLREMDFADQCEYAAELGYQGLEIAPFTLSDDPHLIGPQARSDYRRTAEAAGVRITGLHWLLLTPEGLSVTARDESVRKKTLDVMRGLVELCGDVGGKVLVHGSPKQRMIEDQEDRAEAVKRARDLFASVAESAEQSGIVYCLEALSKAETNFINSIQEAVDLAEEVGSPAFRTMLDTKAALLTETESIPALLDRWIPSGWIAHIHVNDSNLRVPGQGQDRFAPIFESLLRNQYGGVVSVEPFDYYPNGKAAAARAIGYIQGILEALKESPVDPV
jgi:sugar phosphate isomerase/epimerase